MDVHVIKESLNFYSLVKKAIDMELSIEVWEICLHPAVFGVHISSNIIWPFKNNVVMLFITALTLNVWPPMCMIMTKAIVLMTLFIAASPIVVTNLDALHEYLHPCNR